MNTQDMFAKLTEKVITLAMKDGLSREGDIEAMANLMKSCAEFNASVTPSHTVGNIGDGAQVAINGSILNGGANTPSYRGPSSGKSFRRDPIKVSKQERYKGAQACATEHTPPEGWEKGTYSSPQAMPDGADLSNLPPGSTCFYFASGKEVPEGFKSVKEEGGVKLIVPYREMNRGDIDDEAPPKVERSSSPPEVGRSSSPRPPNPEIEVGNDEAHNDVDVEFENDDCD